VIENKSDSILLTVVIIFGDKTRGVKSKHSHGDHDNEKIWQRNYASTMFDTPLQIRGLKPHVWANNYSSLISHHMRTWTKCRPC